MTIAVHIRHSSVQDPGYLQACFTILARQYPDHHFIFFKEKNQPMLLHETNCRFFNISPSIKNNLLLHYWYNYKLPGLLIKNNADVFINDYAVTCLRTNIRQVMLVKDMQNMQHLILHSKGSRYAKQFFSKFVSKADAICTNSDFIKEILQQKFPVESSKIQSIYHGLPEFCQPLSFQQKEAVLEKYTGGFSYFFYEVTPHTSGALLPLLKAFSQFKKWQKSSFKLLLFYTDNIPGEPVEGFRNYKHREDVLLLSNLSPAEAAGILAAAYSVIHLPAFYDTGLTGLQALKCAVPLISADDNFCQSLFADAARYCNKDADDIAKKMINVYKEEAQNNILIQKGIHLTKKFSWQNAANLLWNALLPQ